MGFLSGLDGGDEMKAAGRHLVNASKVGLDWDRFSRANTVDLERNYYQGQGQAEVDRINKDLKHGRADVMAGYNAGVGNIRNAQQSGNAAIGANTAQMLGQVQRSGSSGSALLSGLRSLAGQANASYLQGAAGAQGQMGSLAGQRMGNMANLAAQFGSMKSNAVNQFSQRGMQAGQATYENMLGESMQKRSMEQEVHQARAQKAQMDSQAKAGRFKMVTDLAGGAITGGLSSVLGAAGSGLTALGTGANGDASGGFGGFLGRAGGGLLSNMGAGIGGGGGGGLSASQIQILKDAGAW